MNKRKITMKPYHEYLIPGFKRITQSQIIKERKRIIKALGYDPFDRIQELYRSMFVWVK